MATAHQTDVWTNAVAGGLAGCAVDAVLFPLDTVKTLMQLRPSVSASTSTAAPARAAFDVRKFYRGFTANMLASFPAAASFFSAYEFSKRHLLATLPPDYASVAYMGAGAFGDFTSCLVRVPFEVTKQQMQAGVHVVAGQPPPSTARVVTSLWRAGGVRAFYAGFDSTVMRDVPFSAFQLLLLEQGKRAYERANHGQQTPPLGVALIGGLSGGCAAALTTPLDVIKTRLMTQRASAAPTVSKAAAAAAGGAAHSTSVTATVASAEATAPLPYRNALDAFRRIAHEEGWRALFLGLRPRVTWISIGGALFFGAYDVCCNVLSQSHGATPSQK